MQERVLLGVLAGSVESLLGVPCPGAVCWIKRSLLPIRPWQTPGCAVQIVDRVVLVDLDVGVGPPLIHGSGRAGLGPRKLIVVQGFLRVTELADVGLPQVILERGVGEVGLAAVLAVQVGMIRVVGE